MAEKKVTKREWFEVITGIVEASDAENKEDVLAFIQKQVEALDAKAAKAREKAENNKVNGDALRVAVEAVLTTELQTADDITPQVFVEGVDVTKAKVVARLTQLVNAEVAVKDAVKVGDRKLMAYKLA